MATKVFRDVTYLGSSVRVNEYVVGRKGDIEVFERGADGSIIMGVMTFPKVWKDGRWYATGGPVEVMYPIFKTKTGFVVNGGQAGSADTKPWARPDGSVPRELTPNEQAQERAYFQAREEGKSKSAAQRIADRLFRTLEKATKMARASAAKES